MDNPQLAELDASLAALVRRAYELGRADAFKKVADVVKGDSPDNAPLALAAPAGSTGAQPSDMPALTNGAARAYEPPWWVRPFV